MAPLTVPTALAPLGGSMWTAVLIVGEHGEHRGLTRPIDRPAALDQGAREPPSADRADIGHHVYNDERERDLRQPDSVPGVQEFREPVQVEPPDRIGQEVSRRDRPGLPEPEQADPRYTGVLGVGRVAANMCQLVARDTRV